MGRYFLSYARADAEIALKLAADLRAAGADVWVDQHNIQPSERWDRAVETGLRESAGVVLVMSPRAVASENVMDEISVALDSGKQVIPVLVEACQAPLRLARVQFIDATSDYAGALARCQAAMGAAATPAPQPAPAPRAPIAAALIDTLTQQLAPILGPIANHLVQHEAHAAADKGDLIARLRERIPAGADRDRFMAALRDLGH
ncbi:MAG: toll/interleukin-1 receptor domain-containing protein [Pseudomonadota bacterium]